MITSIIQDRAQARPIWGIHVTGLQALCIKLPMTRGVISNGQEAFFHINAHLLEEGYRRRGGGR